MTSLNPYFGFNGKCREAMTFYQECFGGELEIQVFKDTPMGENAPAEIQDNILHSALVIGEIQIMGSDMVGPGGFVKGNDISVAIGCSSEDEINMFFNKLSKGGKVLDPLKTQFWGDIFGAVEDQFGIRWMFNYNKNEQN